MKEIAAHQDEIDVLVDTVPGDHVHPRIKEVPGALRKLVPSATKVHVCDMEKLH
jgi:hypothetical protein